MENYNISEKHTEYLTQQNVGKQLKVKIVWYGYETTDKPTRRFYHREDGPAKIHYFPESEIIESHIYCINGYIHRTDGPAFIRYNKDGTIHSEKYYILGLLFTKEEYYTPGFVDSFILEHS
jgi:hypothetical protein